MHACVNLNFAFQEQLRAELQAGSQVGQDNERLQTELAARNAEIVRFYAMTVDSWLNYVAESVAF